MRRQSFALGAVIIAAATIVAKIFSAVFKIPLDRLILKPEGMALFNSAYSVYNWFLVIAATGLPIAVSKLIAESRARGDDRAAERVAFTAQLMLCGIGVFCSLALFLGARLLAAAVSLPEITAVMRVMSGALIFIGISSAYRGFFQGGGDMLPTAVSQIAEGAGKLIFGLLGGFLFISRPLHITAAAAMSGVVTGAALGALSLFLFKRRQRQKGRARFCKKTAKAILLIAFPITATASVYAFINLIDAFTVMNVFSALGFSQALRKSLFGYLGRAVTLYNLPLTIINGITVSIVPAIAAATARKDAAEGERGAKAALRLTFFISAPACGAFAALAAPILGLLYNDSSHASLLALISAAVIFVPLTQVTSAILQAGGLIWRPVFNMLIGCAVKLALNLLLLPIPGIGINGAPIATSVSYFIAGALNLVLLSRTLEFKLSFSELFFRPALAAVFTGVCGGTVYRLFPSVPGLFAAIAVCAGLYLPFALATKNITRADISSILKKESV